MVSEIVSMTVAPGQSDAFVELFRRTAGPYFHSPGCREVRLFRSHDRPEQLVCLVNWDDVETHKRVRETAAAQQFLSAIWGSFVREPEIGYYDEEPL